MKKQYNLSIPEPCSENWRNFKHTKSGGYCKSCNKEVIDFTQKSEVEIFNFFSKQPAHICGRFRQDQVKTYADSITSIILPGHKLIKAGLSFLIFFFLNKEGIAQHVPSAKSDFVQTQHINDEKKESDGVDYVIKGVVLDEYDDPIPGVNVILKGSNIGIVTDIDGRYEFPVKLNQGDVLSFSYIGFETLEYKIKNEKVAEVNMHMLYYDIMGEVAITELYIPKQSGISRLWGKIKRIF